MDVFAGRYIQMMRLLKPIAFDVMTSMAQLFDFYMYSVSIFSQYYLCFSMQNNHNQYYIFPIFKIINL